jgi:glutamate-ammonia-ligase adenylyltransferase
MALTRARPLAGDGGFGETVVGAVCAVLTRPREPAEVFAAVSAMRDMIEREKGQGEGWDLKLARGGLIDLDFLAQALVLAFGHSHPSLAGLSTEAALAEAGRCGLLDAESAARLVDACRLIGDVHHWQRLTMGGSLELEGAASASMRRLASLAGAPDVAQLRARLDETRDQVRVIFDRVLRAV